MCTCLEVSRSSYYKWLLVKPKSSKVSKLKATIRSIWEKSYKRYGSPKIKAALARQGQYYHLSYIARLMKEMGIKSVVKKKWVKTTNSKHKYPVCENKLNRNFEVDVLGKVWVSDITYIRCNQEWLYLTTIIDLADRKVVGWSLSKDMSAKNTVYAAWIMARRQRSIVEGFLFHSDRGVQYASGTMSNLFLFNRKIEQSMSRKGNCWDNAVAESFFKSIKGEMIYHHQFTSFEETNQAIEEYINWYNTERIHQSLDYNTPLEREQFLRNNKPKRAA